MKLPKTIRRYNPKLRKHTVHRVIIVKRGTTSGMTYGSKTRARERGKARGTGNLGRYSKPAVTKFKMTGKKLSKKVDIRFECTESKHKHVKRNTFRAKKVELR